jgi:hypothetical protein
LAAHISHHQVAVRFKRERERQTEGSLYSVMNYNNLIPKNELIRLKLTKKVLIDTFCKLKYETLNAGLRVKNNKTKYLYCTRKTIQPTYIKTGEEQFEQVNSFKYLGTMVNTCCIPTMMLVVGTPSVVAERLVT